VREVSNLGGKQPGELRQDQELLIELTGQKKNRLFSYAAYVDLLAEGPQARP
jgi:hypothetical protein